MGQVSRIIEVLSSSRISLSDEKSAQNDIQDLFVFRGIPFSREHRLSPSSIVDFYIDGIGLEVKLKARKMTVYRQLRRYATHPTITALILVTNTSMGLPNVIEGKPVYLFKLGDAWL